MLFKSEKKRTKNVCMLNFSIMFDIIIFTLYKMKLNNHLIEHAQHCYCCFSINKIFKICASTQKRRNKKKKTYLIRYTDTIYYFIVYKVNKNMVCVVSSNRSIDCLCFFDYSMKNYFQMFETPCNSCIPHRLLL